MLRSSLALALLLIAPLAASAHGMSMDVKVKGGTVSVELFYDDDTPGANAAVKVFNAAKQVVLEGTTDEKGRWSFPAPPPGEYSVRAKTDDGHAAKQTFTVSEDTTPTPEIPGVKMTGPARWIALGIGLVLISGAFTALYLVIRRHERKRMARIESSHQE